MLLSKPSHLTYEQLKSKIETGNMLIPQFQRDFVWNKAEAAKLLDSILKGYPIGSFILWETKERLRTIKNIGGISLPTPKAGDSVYYVLDGQQRITSIYASLSGAIIGKADYSKLFIDLTVDESQEIVVMNVDGLQATDYISITMLLSNSPADIFATYGSEPQKIEKIFDYQKKFTTYQFPIIEISNADLEIATDIFTRVNNGGKSLATFEIMCAKTYDEKQNFDLYEKREEQKTRWGDIEYETIPDATVLQAAAICISGVCNRKHILNEISKQQFIDAWDDVDKSLSLAIDYVKSALGVRVSKLLPYDGLLVPFVYYFYKHPKSPTAHENQLLKNYFWRCVLSNRFSDGLESKLAQDVEHVIAPILEGKVPTYEKGVDISYDFLKKEGYFSTGNALIKGLLCLLASQHPRSFKNNNEVVIDNDWLSQGNSKNYHHFFPKNYMKKYQPLIPENLVNHIANITIVDSFINKGEIKDKAPSEYMGSYYDSNPEIIATMQTHLIGDFDEYGVFEDNYSAFFEKRLTAIQAAIKTQLIIIEDLDIVK